jgi:hypothetical protein
MYVVSPEQIRSRVLYGCMSRNRESKRPGSPTGDGIVEGKRIQVVTGLGYDSRNNTELRSLRSGNSGGSDY